MQIKGRFAGIAFAALAVAVASAPDARAGKSGGGGGGTPLDGGTIWYVGTGTDPWQVKSMPSTGGSTTTYADLDLGGDWPDVSRATHDSARWFLVIDAEGRPCVVSAASGHASHVLDTTVRADAQADARFRPDPATGAPDARATWWATVNGTRVLYEVAIDWSSFSQGAAAVVFDSGAAGAGLHDWTDDGNTVVYHVGTASGVRIHRRAWAGSGVTTTDLGTGRVPRVSSAANRIAFEDGGSLWTMSLTGSGSDRAEFVTGANVGGLRYAWSPSGTWLACETRSGTGSRLRYTMVLKSADGSTTKSFSNATPMGWVN